VRRTAWASRPPRTATDLLLRHFRLRIRRELRERTGRDPELAEIDQALARVSYRLPEDVADRVLMLSESRRKRAESRAINANCSPRAKRAAVAESYSE